MGIPWVLPTNIKTLYDTFREHITILKSYRNQLFPFFRPHLILPGFPPKWLKAHLHIPSSCPSVCLRQIYINGQINGFQWVPDPFCLSNGPSLLTQCLNFDSDGHGHGDGTFKPTSNSNAFPLLETVSVGSWVILFLSSCKLTNDSHKNTRIHGRKRVRLSYT